MSVKLLTEHHLEFLSLKGGCRGSSESTHVKIPHIWKSHALAHIITYHNIVTKVRDTGTSLNRMNAYYSLVMIYTFSRDLTIPHLDLSHFALCIMGKAIFG